jgi:hypothetical protein
MIVDEVSVVVDAGGQETKAAADPIADEIADEVVCAFATTYPDIALPYAQWQTLREMIAREVQGHYGESEMAAADLIPAFRRNL